MLIRAPDCCFKMLIGQTVNVSFNFECAEKKLNETRNLSNQCNTVYHIPCFLFRCLHLNSVIILKRL